eukprot:10385697-Alexandrium_andersonii.AAC.1
MLRRALLPIKVCINLDQTHARAISEVSACVKLPRGGLLEAGKASRACKLTAGRAQSHHASALASLARDPP